MQSCVLYDSDKKELDEYVHNAASDAPSVLRADSIDFYDSISVIDQSMEAFDSMLQNITAGPEQISFESCEDGYTIHSSLMSDKILYLAIPYSSGWSARLDGETVSCMPADNFGMAAYVPAGGHTVEFEYYTSYLR